MTDKWTWKRTGPTTQCLYCNSVYQGLVDCGSDNTLRWIVRQSNTVNHAKSVDAAKALLLWEVRTR